MAQLNTVLATHKARSQFPPKNKIRKNIKDPQAQWANNNSGCRQMRGRLHAQLVASRAMTTAETETVDEQVRVQAKGEAAHTHTHTI